MNDFLSCSRRDFLQLAGVGAVGLAAVPAQATSGPPAAPAVIVHDPQFSVPADFTAGLDARIVPLNGDPVRLWRDGLKDAVAAGRVLYGLTLWADLLIFQGLASELRRHVRVVRQDETTGRFAWIIA